MPPLPIESSHALRCHYSREPLEQVLTRDDLLVAINYNDPCLPTANPRHYNCGLTMLSADTQTELWTSSQPISHGSQDQCHWSQTDEALFIGLVVDETAFSHQQQAIADAYRRLLALAAERGYRHMIRAWNYMAAINEGHHDEERYRHFCIGRQQAFSQHHYDIGHYPSACALGHHQGQTIIYLLAAKQAGQHFENPNQQSAYQYPRQYGPQSPSFARATLVDWSDSSQLYISGTASIVGHRSILGDSDNHLHDLHTQLDTTLSNIDQLLAHVARQAQLSQRPTPASLKVYIRHAADYPEVKAALEKHYDNRTALLYLQADICREELLIEIDGLCEL